MIKTTKKPPRAHVDGAVYFLTFCTFERAPILHREGIPELLIEKLNQYRSKVEELIAYTIMPDHMHLLLHVGSNDQISRFLIDYKGGTSREIQKHVAIPSGHVWQRGTMDHWIRNSWKFNDYRNHVHYLFYNSQKHLRINPRDFPYHNFTEFVERGLLEPDFCAFNEDEFPFVTLYEDV